MENKKVLYKIKSLNTLIFREIGKNCETNKGEKIVKATPTQMQILAYILECRDKEIYQRDLEKVLNLRRATVSGVLKTMEKNDLVKRVTDNNDTRSKKIILQEKAINIFKRHKKLMLEIENNITKNIPEEEIEIFCNIIDKMKENIKNMWKEKK